MIKLIAIDMDGTLLNEAKEVTKPQIEMLHKAVEKGIKIVICTGRALSGVKPIYEKIGLKQDEYAILNNGCSTHHTSDWSLVSWHQLTKNDMLYLNRINHENKDVQFTLFDEEHYFCVDEEPQEQVKKDASLVFLEPQFLSIDEAISGEYTMFQGMFLAAPERLDIFQEKYEKELSEHFSVVRSQSYIFETMPKGATKATALEKLANSLNIKREEIMAIGDANNDLEMLAYAGVSVAMGNATENVKAIATHITDTNEQDGVAKAIELYALEQEV
ncbi:Cof-type HAD-IIB family hydrolase [Granulicatella sp. zg-ZJ]|uniref:Cof-type HAD-IIB family hydrolase n=1 Tax=unclassified Granulicatella TaxID=2630493 RepID=UPI0013C0514A|nr:MULTISPECIES: Cof-type HAD-IIB family hydrolase [unclassified Granulicatella]MBS4749496.1 HAD family phosphatase [Carnobacteriaceae bacterium zg-ZUI78]NEW62219.1 Cof-type HAD-IIB family hydrolase [Granulicatella sp. zg-ZJ]NEW66025.1 Cof-type HAD-IIB family hydrolase [Granulicatella sp. zg-84]QMI86558.1 HAD family phosphatase [Carnobacteriaceae bacterium zg-84]